MGEDSEGVDRVMWGKALLMEQVLHFLWQVMATFSSERE